jgi:hypothetical protein
VVEHSFYLNVEDLDGKQDMDNVTTKTRIGDNIGKIRENLRDTPITDHTIRVICSKYNSKNASYAR